MFKIEPIREPLLERILGENLLKEYRLGDARLLVPETYMVLAMKMKAIRGRQKDDKRLKDACDIYSLLWHSSTPSSEILKVLKREYPDICKAARKAINAEVASEAAKHIGIDVEKYKGVIKGLNR